VGLRTVSLGLVPITPDLALPFAISRAPQVFDHGAQDPLRFLFRQVQLGPPSTLGVFPPWLVEPRREALHSVARDVLWLHPRCLMEKDRGRKFVKNI
jgi:hypothetical protein